MVQAQHFAAAVRDEQSPVGKWLDELAETATELDAEAAERGAVAPLIIEAIVEELLQWALAPITAGASVAIGKAIQLMGTLIKQFGKRVLDILDVVWDTLKGGARRLIIKIGDFVGEVSAAAAKSLVAFARKLVPDLPDDIDAADVLRAMLEAVHGTSRLSYLNEHKARSIPR